MVVSFKSSERSYSEAVNGFSEVDAMVVVEESSGSIGNCIGGAQNGTRGTWYTHGE